MALFGDIAGEAVARRLGVSPAGDGRGDPTGPAVISALLDPGHKQAGAPAVPGPGDRWSGREGRAVPQSASPDETISQLTREVVNRLFSVGLSLERARTIVGDGPGGDPIAVATTELDQVIREIRTMMFRLAADRGRHAADLPALPCG